MPSLKQWFTDWVAKSFRLAGTQPTSAYDSFGGFSDSQDTKDIDYIQSSTGVYACATLRAETLATVPLRLYKGDDPENREVVTSGALFDLLHKVNPFWTLPYLIEMTELALSMTGEAFWVLERGPSGEGTPEEIWWANPGRMEVKKHNQTYIGGFVLTVEQDKIAFKPSEVIWFRNPNPIDEYKGLSPVSAARMSIDLGIAGLTSNKKVFENGSQMAGVVSPHDKDAKMTKEQAETLSEMLNRRFRGVKNAHRLAVLTQSVKFDSVSLTPKDAEFLGQMRWSLGDVCRVFKVSPILVQDLEHSTYSNFEQALKALYVLCLIPQARRIAGWLKEQLLPMFPDEADDIEFDFSAVEVLQEAQDAKWTREQGQITAGVLTINEWRKRQGMDTVPWGDTWYKPAINVSVEAVSPPQEGEELPPDDGTVTKAIERALAAVKSVNAARAKGIAFDSPEHKAAFKKFDRKATRHEARVKKAVESLFEQQRDAIVKAIGAKKSFGHKAIDADDPFDIDEWVNTFKAGLRGELEDIVQSAGDDVYDELKVSHSFDVHNDKVTSFLDVRAQRFAEAVNETTWTNLKASLNEGEKAGEGIDQLAARVQAEMGDRIRSSAEVIARTETIGALNGGALEAAKQSGVVKGKGWLAALDGRQRDTHEAAHNQYQGEPIPIDDDFEVGAGAGPAPGQIGVAEEDIQCRCSMTWVVEGDE